MSGEGECECEGEGEGEDEGQGQGQSQGEGEGQYLPLRSRRPKGEHPADAPGLTRALRGQVVRPWAGAVGVIRFGREARRLAEGAWLG